MIRRKPIRPVDVADVRIDDSFWNPFLENNRVETISHQYDQLETSGCLENFRRAADGESGEFQGMWFADSDAYKWIEAASYVLMNRDDPDLRDRIDGVVDLIAAAQEPNGYLNTYVSLEEPNLEWTNIMVLHELYCAGHLIEAAVAHYRATSDRALLDVATDFADHIDEVFVDEIEAAPGHEEIELALVKLYRATDERRYLDLAKYFVDVRGTTDRFDWETEHNDEIAGEDYDYLGHDLTPDECAHTYHQSHAPLRDQETVEGHAVRAMYLFSGAADVAGETDDEELLAALEELWQNMTEKRIYITGGIGSTADGERFTEDYHLPNETAYAETCAAIGSVFWNRRLFEHTGEAKYVDLVERTLYNGVIAGVSLDGTEFFYENPLESRGDHHRQGWFECACCPPNVARLLAALERYIYATDGEDLWINQYVGSTASTTLAGTPVTVGQTSEFPWETEATIDVEAATPVEGTIHVRVPEWSSDATITVNGEPVTTSDGGYTAIERTWDDDRIEVRFDRAVEQIAAHPAVASDAGTVAIVRDPLVYCLEGVDNDRPLHQYVLDSEPDFQSAYNPDLLGGVVTISTDVSVPELDDWDGELYRSVSEASDRSDDDITAVPYYAWDNREGGPMRVWVRNE